jgi:cell division septation protein DedD
MATRQTRRQLQFTGFEMAMIAVSFVVTVTAVFFLGLFVGKKNASHHAPAEERVARIPVDDFTRYKRPAPIAPVPKEARQAAAAPAAATAAAETTAAATAKVAAPGGSAGAGEAANSAAPSTPAAPPLPSAQGPAVDPAKPGAAASTAAAETAAKDDATKVKDAAAKDKEQVEPATGRGYTVQILATRKQADADALVRKLKSRGYAAYIKKVSDGEGAWYRVRVGSYGAFSEARAMADRCRRDLGLGQAFVSTE